MNVQLVDSLVEIVSKLTPEDQKLFLSKLSHINIILPAEQQNLTSAEKVVQFQELRPRKPKPILINLKQMRRMLLKVL